MSWDCKKCGETNDDLHTDCWKCVLEVEREPGEAISKDSRSPVFSMPCSTTPDIPGRTVIESRGIVGGEAILGANIFRDFAAGITNIVGGRSGFYESKLKEGRHFAFSAMIRDAKKLGADAVIGIDVDYEFMSGMLMICVSGTAVTLEKEQGI